MTTTPNPPPTTYDDAVAALAHELVLRLGDAPGHRFMLGVTGGPGAGKSTFTDSLCSHLNSLFAAETAVVVPMDGFHKTNAELHALGMWPQKGEPETFDANAFVGLLGSIRNDPGHAIPAPRFDRSTDEPVPDALYIRPSHRVVIVEGNYLLLPNEPWNNIPALLDEVWYLDAPTDVVVTRLETRHRQRGLTGDALMRKITASDLKNAQRIAEGKQVASRILTLPLRH